MDEKLAKLWQWHHNLQNDIREAQALIKCAKIDNDNELITRIDNLITEADNLAHSIEQDIKIICVVYENML